MVSEGWSDSSCYGDSRLCNSAALFGRRVRNATDSDDKKNRHCVLFDCPESSVSYAIVLVPWLVGGRRLKMRELSHDHHPTESATAVCTKEASPLTKPLLLTLLAYLIHHLTGLGRQWPMWSILHRVEFVDERAEDKHKCDQLWILEYPANIQEHTRNATWAGSRRSLTSKRNRVLQDRLTTHGCLSTILYEARWTLGLGQTSETKFPQRGNGLGVEGCVQA